MANQFLTKQKGSNNLELLFLGQPMSYDYFSRVQAPLLLTQLKWNPRIVLNMFRDNDLHIPNLPQFVEILRDEQLAKEMQERNARIAEEHRRANFPTPEEIAEDRKRKAERIERQRQYIEEQRKARGLSSVVTSSNDTISTTINVASW
ncbi:hypothetical protein GBN33_13305 [Plesiomonas shigelloides]|uniref:hypothetical protein n=1 Tax=Plesiomonas shigelloides TaxID=703 RepID=UPI00126208C6|nr:hypothetical protein [Plesiomonas shigelloides]KAB7696578.1 hypothetical protein GBN33_13305 [Plesiomonas shigelloides]